MEEIVGEVLGPDAWQAVRDAGGVLPLMRGSAGVSLDRGLRRRFTCLGLLLGHVLEEAGRTDASLDGPKAAATAFARLALLDHEEMHVAFLDAKHRPIRFARVAVGGAASVECFPQPLFRLAISLSAVALVLAHNHPSGDPTPSETDRHLTERMAAAAALLDLKLLDHVIIGAGGCYFSFAEKYFGRLAPPIATTVPSQ